MHLNERSNRELAWAIFWKQPIQMLLAVLRRFAPGAKTRRKGYLADIIELSALLKMRQQRSWSSRELASFERLKGRLNYTEQDPALERWLLRMPHVHVPTLLENLYGPHPDRGWQEEKFERWMLECPLGQQDAMEA